MTVIDFPLSDNRLADIVAEIRTKWARVSRDVTAMQRLLNEARELCRTQRVSFDKWCRSGDLGIHKTQIYNLLNGRSSNHVHPVNVLLGNPVETDAPGRDGRNFMHAITRGRVEAAAAGGYADEYYTAAELFRSFNRGSSITRFDTDVASPGADVVPDVPALRHITKLEDALGMSWAALGFIFCNPPHGLKNNIDLWLAKFCEHGNGVMLVPDWTSAGWYHDLVAGCDAMMVLKPKVQFQGLGNHNMLGTTLFACGARGIQALKNAHNNGRGKLLFPYRGGRSPLGNILCR